MFVPVVLFAFIVSFTFSAVARIPVFAFKDVSAVFLEDRTFYSPTFGLAALDTGLIYNLRYYGDYIRGLDSNNSREYISDKSNDNLWNLVKILFPSQGGGISPVSPASSTNLGRYAQPETVALLLNYAFMIRNNFTLDSSSLIDKIISSLKKSDCFTSRKRGNLKKSLKPLLTSIESSLGDEVPNGRPDYLTELVLLAFFVDLFNERNDIKRLLITLDDRIVDRNKVNNFKPNDILIIDDLESALKSPVLSLDQTFVVMYQRAFTNFIPYESDSQPAELVEVKQYDRASDTFSSTKFRDCVENSIRHLFNLTIYDKKSSAFNINNLEKYANEHSDGKNFQKFKDFYVVQTPEMVNTNDESIRSLWNKITGDLNVDGYEPKIDYWQKTNELDTSFVNIINVFKKVFGLETSVLSKNSSIREQQIWVEESMIKLLKIIDPNREYKVSFSGPTSMQFLVSYPDSPQRFSFTFYSDNKHSKITDVHVDGAQSYRSPAAKNLPIKLGSAQEIIFLLRSDHSGMATNALFLIWQCSVESNKGKAKILREFINNYERLSLAQKEFFEKSMLLILGDFGWSDQNAVNNEFMPLSELFGKFASLKPKFTQQVHGWSHNGNIDLKKLFQKYPHLQHLWLKNTEVLNVTGAHSLKTLHIDCPSKYFQLSGLNQLARLESLKITGDDASGKISLAGLENLILLDLSFSNIHLDEQGLTGKEYLQIVNLEYYAGYGHLSFKGVPNLRYVNLKDASRIESAPGLDEIKTLEYLDLNGAKSLSGQLEFDDLSNLRFLGLAQTNLSSIKISNLPRLTKLDLSYTTQLKTLELGSLSNLQELDLSSSAVKVINGLQADNLKSIQSINLYNAAQINDETLFLSGFSNLRSLNLESTCFKNLRLWDNHALENLILSNNQSLRYLEITGYSVRLKHLSAINTSLERVNFVGLSKYPVEPEEINFDFSFSNNLSTIIDLNKHFNVNQLKIKLGQ